MSSNDQGAASGPARSEQEGSVSGPPRANTAAQNAPRWLILAGVLAGCVAFGAGEATYEWIRPENGRINTMGNVVIAPTAETAGVAEVKNAAVANGILGMCLGGFLGIAGGLARQSRPRALIASVVGLVLCAIAGAILSLALLPYFLKVQPAYVEYELVVSALMHGSIWGLIGALAGLAFAGGLGDRKFYATAALAGILGALLGGLAFDVAGAAFFPFAGTSQPVSITWSSRLLARLLVTIGVAIVVSLSLPRSHAGSVPVLPAP